MIRHQAVSANAHRQTLRAFAHDPLESGVIRILVKDMGAAGPAIADVIDETSGHVAWTTRHSDNLMWRHRSSQRNRCATLCFATLLAASDDRLLVRCLCVLIRFVINGWAGRSCGHGRACVRLERRASSRWVWMTDGDRFGQAARGAGNCTGEPQGCAGGGGRLAGGGGWETWFRVSLTCGSRGRSGMARRWMRRWSFWGGVTFGRFAATTNCHVRTTMSSDRAKTGSAAGWGGYGTTTVRVRCESGAESDATQEHNILFCRVFTDGLGAGLPG